MTTFKLKIKTTCGTAFDIYVESLDAEEIRRAIDKKCKEVGIELHEAILPEFITKREV